MNTSNNPNPIDNAYQPPETITLAPKLRNRKSRLQKGFEILIPCIVLFMIFFAGFRSLNLWAGSTNSFEDFSREDYEKYKNLFKTISFINLACIATLLLTVYGATLCARHARAGESQLTNRIHSYYLFGAAALLMGIVIVIVDGYSSIALLSGLFARFDIVIFRTNGMLTEIFKLLFLSGGVLLLLAGIREDAKIRFQHDYKPASIAFHLWVFVFCASFVQSLAINYASTNTSYMMIQLLTYLLDLSFLISMILALITLTKLVQAFRESTYEQQRKPIDVSNTE